MPLYFYIIHLVHVLFTTNVKQFYSGKGKFNCSFAQEIAQPDDGNSSTIHPLLLYPFLTSVISFITEL